MSSPQITRTGVVSPVLAIVIEALEHQADRAGEAAALRDFGDLAIREIVAHIIAVCDTAYFYAGLALESPAGLANAPCCDVRSTVESGRGDSLRDELQRLMSGTHRTGAGPAHPAAREPLPEPREPHTPRHAL